MVMMGEIIAVLKCEWFFNREILKDLSARSKIVVSLLYIGLFLKNLTKQRTSTFGWLLP
jgi:hypothetical protein